MGVEVCTTLNQPRLVRRIIDVGVAHLDMGVVVRTGLQMVGLTALGMVGALGCLLATVTVVQRFGRDLRDELFRKVQRLSFGDLDRLETGSLITRLTNDVNQVQDALTMVLRHGVRIGSTLVGSLIMAAVTCPRLAVIFLFLVPAVFGLLTFVIRRSQPLFAAVQKRLDRLNTVLRENLGGVRVVRVFARASHESARFGRANDDLATTNIAAARLGATTLPLANLALHFAIVAAVALGGFHLGRRNLEVGQVVAFITYLTQTLNSLVMTSVLTMQASRAHVSSRRVMEVLDLPDEQPGAELVAPVQVAGRIAFEDVSFSYRPSDQDPVLRHISFVVDPGQTVAIIGATGAGKSTLVALMAGFYRPSAGRITLDGVDLRALDLRVLRNHIAIALQEAVLFGGSIRDNIRFGRPDASDEDVQAAALSAQADEFIQALPGTYDAPVLKRGVNLSGGQRQRLNLARALLMRAPVLILDDSTSAVDVHTEARIRQALAASDRHQTRIIVAQSIAQIRHADQILVLDDGHLVGAGSHAQLLARSRVYQEIYASQEERRAPDGAFVAAVS
jgi:ATP-binding cassette subfamily B protein